MPAVRDVARRTGEETLFGREHDLGVLLAFLDGASAAGGALLLTGQPGVGKSALLCVAARQARTRGGAVVRITGAEFDGEAGFGALGRLLKPFLLDVTGPRKAAVAVLRAVLDRGEAASSSPLAVSHAALALLVEAARARPLLLVVDDLPSVDRASSRVLRFIARRLAGSRIGILAAARCPEDGNHEPSGLPEHEVTPLTDTAADSLLAHHFPAMPSRVRTRLQAQARGNPLALLELPTMLSTWQRTVVGAQPAVAPLSRRLYDAFRTRIDGLPADTRQVLLVAALDGTGELRTLRAVAPGPAGLAPAERLGLVGVDDGSATLTFRHPLIGAAVVHGASEAERRTVHRLLAEVHLSNRGRRAWHLAEATIGPDEQVASLLHASAHVTLRRSDPVHAMSELLRAAELSPTAAARSTRMALAAHLGTVVTGDLHNAPRLLDAARRIATGPSHSVALATASHLLNEGGDVQTAQDLLASAVDAAPNPRDAADETLVEALYGLLLATAFGGGPPDRWEAFQTALGQLTPRPPELLTILGVTLADPARSSPSVRGRLDAIIARLPQETSPARIVRVGLAACYVDRLPACREALTRVVGYGREGGPVTSAVEALFLLGNDAFFSGQWGELECLVDEGLDLCDRHGYRLLARHGRFLRALLAAARGDEVLALATVREMTDWARSRHAGLIEHYAANVGALAALGRGDFDAAYRFATAITPAGTIAVHAPHALWTIVDTVEAALRTGRHAQAQAHVDAARDAALGTISPRLAFLTGVAEALVAPDGRDCELFAELLARPCLDRWPFDLARAELSYGERLRRLKVTGVARIHLTSALETFARLGAQPWVARASNELRAAGNAPDRLPTPRTVVLTTQQRQIVVLAAEGLTNKQIGERLFLSPRTVSAHLYQVFPKFGITSRAALRDALTRLQEQSFDSI
jgi:DNA-binding CsgD family transcriptional regulator